MSTRVLSVSLVVPMLCTALQGVAQATPPPAAIQEDVRVGALALSRAAFEILLDAARARDGSSVSRSQALAALTEDHVLGRYALEQFGDAKLLQGRRVGQALSVLAEAAVVALVERRYAEQITAALRGAGPQQWVRQQHALTPEVLRRQLAVGVLRLDDRLTAAQTRALTDVPLLDAAFPEGPSLLIDLKTLWDRLDAHGRSELYRLNVAFVHRQAQEILHSAFIRHWAQRHAGITPSDWQQLVQLMADRERRLALQEVMGAGPSLHVNSPALARLRSEVSKQDIAHYYAQHPEQFERLERVWARYVRCPDESSAWAAYAELDAGQSFEDVARRRSDPSGDRSTWAWVERPLASHQWLEQFLFAHPPGAPSRPVRESDDAGAWLIVQVGKRQVGRHPPDSETVRFIAGVAIARERASERFAKLRERLLHAQRPGSGVAATRSSARSKGQSVEKLPISR